MVGNINGSCIYIVLVRSIFDLVRCRGVCNFVDFVICIQSADAGYAYVLNFTHLLRLIEENPSKGL